MEKTVEQPKGSIPKTNRIQDKIVPIPNYTVPNVRSIDYSGSRMINRKTLQDVKRAYQDPFY